MAQKLTVALMAQKLTVATMDTGGISRGGMQYLAVGSSECIARRLIAERYVAYHAERLGDEGTARDWIAWEIADGEMDQISSNEGLSDALAAWYGITTTELEVGTAVIL